MCKDIILPAPLRNADMSLVEAVSKRRSDREFSEREIDLQVLSDLLWISWGYNREGRRTAPSSHNSQETELYVALPSGIYVYEPMQNKLACVLQEDVRALTGTQDFVAAAPLNIVFVADLSLLVGKDERAAYETAYVDTGFISQNLYLACAAYGLESVIRVSIDKAALAEKLRLPANKIITLAQTVGYAK